MSRLTPELIYTGYGCGLARKGLKQRGQLGCSVLGNSLSGSTVHLHVVSALHV